MRLVSRAFVPLSAALLAASLAHAQAPPLPTAARGEVGAPAGLGGRVRVPPATPRPDDVATIDGILKAFYEVVSGAPGAPRQWSRDRSLYIPGVRFVSNGVGKDGKPRSKVMSHQEFVDGSDAMLAEGFDEREIHRVTERFGNIAHVMSTYESRKTKDGPVTERGINSIELVWDGSRWWIAGAIWDEERPGTPIPKEYLP
jgi:hypothetical protein